MTFILGMLIKSKNLRNTGNIKLVIDVVHPSADGYTVLKTIELGRGGAPKLDWIFDEYWEEA